MPYPSARLQRRTQLKDGVLGESQGLFEWIFLALCHSLICKQTAYVLLPREFFQIFYPIPRLEKEEQKKEEKENVRAIGIKRRREREPNSELSAEEKHLKTCYS